ncbi:MAG: AMP-binding protein [Ilumatobacteraceae bacterium]
MVARPVRRRRVRGRRETRGQQRLHGADDEVRPPHLLAGAGWSLPGLQMLLYGAASITPSRLSQSIEVFGPVLNQSYGQTEAPNTITLLTADEHRPRRLGSSGLPYAGVSVAILDEDGHPLPPGEIGEICVRGPQVMTGYLDQPDATALALRDGWLWTGDRGHVDDEGYVYHAGRSKDMIISGGYNIYPGEIEAVLDAQPGVVQSVVIGVPDEHWGEAVKALVVCRTGAVEEAALRAAVRHAKGSIHVPKSFEFVEALPLTPLGKPDRALIRTVHGASRRP